jgi:molecular chaperone DnaK (HSP70)
MPFFGKGSFLSNGLPLPTGILFDSIATRDLPAQIRFRKSEYDINNLISQSASKELLIRFKNMHKLQAQHKILIEAERIKIQASNNSILNINLSFIEPELRPEIELMQVENSIQASVSQVLDEVKKTANYKDITPEIVFITGGMSQSPSLINAIKKEFVDGTEIRVLSPLSAVGTGLGLVASNLTQGVHIEHYHSLGLAS